MNLSVDIYWKEWHFFWKLRTKKTETKNQLKFSFDDTCANLEVLIENLKEEIDCFGTEIYEFDYRGKRINLRIFWTV